MTYLEKALKDYPEYTEKDLKAVFCPADLDLENKYCEDFYVGDFNKLHCDDCWNRIYGEYEEDDKVNHPSHYTHGMEAIDEMRYVFGDEVVAHFCLCNVWKYRKRALHKNGQEDLDKSDWYMNKYWELMYKGDLDE